MNVDKPSNGSATAPSSLHGKPDEEVLFDEPKYTKGNIICPTTKAIILFVNITIEAM